MVKLIEKREETNPVVRQRVLEYSFKSKEELDSFLEFKISKMRYEIQNSQSTHTIYIDDNNVKHTFEIVI
jgi:hypothetical protein